MWGLIVFVIGKDSEAKLVLEISQASQAGACAGGEGQALFFCHYRQLLLGSEQNILFVTLNVSWFL